VEIPGIGVASDLEDLGRNPDGTVEVPDRWDVAGWFADGAAVILGHVDSRQGPAVFARVGELAAGDEIVVERSDGSAVTFVVERTERHDKERFPTEEVYFPTLEPELRLVTCGGSFDRSTGHYRDNVIVFAALAA
jgi:streptogramin lyase